MSRALHIVGAGAVTSVGLDARQTCAAIRCKMSRIEKVLRSSPFGKPQPVSRVPCHWKLRSSPFEFLVNMAARALSEIIRSYAVDPARSALVMMPPETFRHAAFLATGSMDDLASRVCSRAGAVFGNVLQIGEGGAASLAAALDAAAALLRERHVERVVIGGVDSYVLDQEYLRLDAAGRLRTEETAQGFTPGEGAAFLLLSRDPEPTALGAAVVGWGAGVERSPAISDGYSQGVAAVEAMRAAASRSGVEEPGVGWLLSNANGERYAAWESVLAGARFFRTRRERLMTTYPAMSVGETGAASAALALLACAHGFSLGYRRAASAMVQVSSEGAGRAACVLIPTGGHAWTK